MTPGRSPESGSGMGSMAGMVNCAEAERRLHRFLDRELTPEEEAEVRLHLDSCENCRTRYRVEADLKRLVQRSGRRAAAPSGLRERIKHRLLGLEEPRAGRE